MLGNEANYIYADFQLVSFLGALSSSRYGVLLLLVRICSIFKLCL